jgi:Mrp family chromosome partitioning ATPase
MLARIPRPARRLRRDGKLAMLTGVEGPEAEIYRTLRTNLEIMNLDRGASTILVTSATEGEGKSTTVANLAAALARAGRRVVLVDLDLRHSRLHRLFELDNSEGVTQVLLGTSRVDEVLQDVPIPGGEMWNGDGDGASRQTGRLEVIPAGAAPRNVSELIASPAVRELFEDLAERADLVLIDTPPLLPVSDAVTLSAEVDSLFLVTNLTLLKRPIVRELKRVLHTCPTTKLGFALTGAETEELAYGGAYGNGSYYGSAAGTEARTRA